MQIPIISGIYTDSKADYRSAYPVNMKPIVHDTGISQGYLRPVEGIVKKGTGPGISRGAINWNGKHYRVMGSKLCVINESNSLTILGDVGNDGKPVSMAYSFDRLAIASNENLFYLTSGTLAQVTDSDLGKVIDVVWIDGYFMTTDGANLVITELTNPFDVNPFKYGSSEIDPDPVICLLKLRNEVYAINRYTIEVFDNIGGDFFPFQRIDGAQVPRGALGTKCATVYEQYIAFLGSSPGESPGIYLAGNGTSKKISSREVDEILATFSEEELSRAELESVTDRSHELLWVRLQDRTLVFDLKTTTVLGEPVWYIMSSGNYATLKQYRARDVIWCYDNWQVGDTEEANFGQLDSTVATHYGENVSWEFSTQIIYNNSMGVVFNSLELVALTGRITNGKTPLISTAYSLDGRNWSQERIREVGVLGDRLKRIVWRRQGSMRSNRIQRFRGDSSVYIAVSRLEAELEPLLR